MNRHIFAGRTYRDRVHAGRTMAEHLDAYRDRDDVVVLALPRGGVPVAAQVAEYLDVPMDVFLVRKLGVPAQPELAAGAISSDGAVVINDDVVRGTGMTPDDLDAVTARERRELGRREEAYRGERPMVEVRDKTVIVVDDGIATGATMRAAVRALRKLGAAAMVVAVPVGPPGVHDDLADDADHVICPSTPRSFGGVGSAYDHFEQLADDEVRSTLARTTRAR